MRVSRRALRQAWREAKNTTFRAGRGGVGSVVDPRTQEEAPPERVSEQAEETFRCASLKDFRDESA